MNTLNGRLRGLMRSTKIVPTDIKKARKCPFIGFCELLKIIPTLPLPAAST